MVRKKRKARKREQVVMKIIARMRQVIRQLTQKMSNFIPLTVSGLKGCLNQRGGFGNGILRME